MPKIDRDNKTPVYRQIYDDISLRIQQGEFPPGSMLPSESKLCSLYGVERSTVRRALAMMVDDGKISKIPGLGTSVTNPADTRDPGVRRTLLFLLPRGVNDTDLISEPFNAKLMGTMERECSRRGYTLLYKPYSQTDTADELIRSCNPCGVMFTSVLQTDIYRTLHSKGIPSVLVNQSQPGYPSVGLDNPGAARMVTEYLMSLGHRRIGFISVDSNHQANVERYNGYREALERGGVEMNKDWLVYGDWTMGSGRKAMRELIGRGNLPTAVIAANDAMAIGAIMEAQSSGLSVPEDVSVAGFDNIDQSSFIRPALTTVAVDYRAMSRATGMLLSEMLGQEGSELNVSIFAPLYLIDRESTRRVTS